MKITEIWLRHLKRHDIAETRLMQHLAELGREYEDYKTSGNWGQLLCGFKKIDMDREVTLCSPKWLRQRKEQINAKNNEI